jgi:excisionase family DNA binding protein
MPNIAGKKKLVETTVRKPTAQEAAIDSATFLTCKQAAEILKMSEITVRRFLTHKKLRRFKSGSRTLVSRAEVLALIREA